MTQSAFFTVVWIALTAAQAAAQDDTATQDMVADHADAPRVLIVLTNHGQLGDTGMPTGYYLSEAAHPWHVFTEAGYDIHLASPKGGEAPADPKSLKEPDEISRAFIEDEPMKRAVANTRAAGELDPAHYDAIYFAGGHGTMWDFPGNDPLERLTRAIYEQGGVVGAVCHGPAALVDVKLSDDTYLVAGKTVAAFTDEEEAAVGLAEVVPFLLERRLRDRGAAFVESPNFEERVAVADRLVTGQNPASARGVAEAMVKAIEARPR